ncbi:MAG: hypothetical protein JO037_07650, partial [Actinobacteria bacterium]|nr:hypothetical protein [Actinomycetota bacterium]
MAIRPGAVRVVLAACLLALLALTGTLAGARPADAAAAPAAARQHVVIVGISGLRWSDVSPAATPTLWRLAGQGSAGSLVDYAVRPLTCPADGWLTLNSGARAQSGHASTACGAFPAVTPAGAGAVVPGLGALEAYNQRFHNDPDWGLLAREVKGCATAAGPGAALALADRSGHVGSYLPAPPDLSAAVLSRCPLTVIDLGSLGDAERARALALADGELARIAAGLPPGSTLLITAPGAAAGPPHLQLALVDGPGYRAGLLDSASTRQPGLVVLTDLTPTVLGWLGGAVPAGAVGAPLTRAGRGPLAATVRWLTGRDAAEQVWRSTHNVFFWAYALAGAAVLAAIGLALPGAAEDQRRRRARWWRVAGVFAAAVPAGTFLANLVPWPASAHPAGWLYGVSAALALVVGLVALRGPWRRDPLGPFGAVCLFTLVVLGVDVMTGSRLQLETPFGLSVLEAGRFYGIGNEALGIYGICGLVAAAWLALALLRRPVFSGAFSPAASRAAS